MTNLATSRRTIRRLPRYPRLGSLLCYISVRIDPILWRFPPVRNYRPRRAIAEGIFVGRTVVIITSAATKSMASGGGRLDAARATGVAWRLLPRPERFSSATPRIRTGLLRSIPAAPGACSSELRRVANWIWSISSFAAVAGLAVMGRGALGLVPGKHLGRGPGVSDQRADRGMEPTAVTWQGLRAVLQAFKAAEAVRAMRAHASAVEGYVSTAYGEPLLGPIVFLPSISMRALLLRLMGYTYCFGRKRGKIVLSQQRADAVRTALDPLEVSADPLSSRAGFHPSVGGAARRRCRPAGGFRSRCGEAVMAGSALDRCRLAGRSHAGVEVRRPLLCGRRSGISLSVVQRLAHEPGRVGRRQAAPVANWRFRSGRGEAAMSGSTRTPVLLTGPATRTAD